MPRDPVNHHTCWIVGFSILIGIIGCDRLQNSKSDETNTNRNAPRARGDDKTKSHSVVTDNLAAEIVVPQPKMNRSPGPVFRPDDLRVDHDDQRLAEVGIRAFESKRLKLYTDIDAKLASPLPALIDELYEAWEDYFGPLPPDRAGTDFQITGYIMRDMGLFRGLGLIPEDLTFDHGSHVQNEFWMREQEIDYYRRHLLIHEATHCFMTFMPGVDAPRWYLEGMAEYFAAHSATGRNKVAGNDDHDATGSQAQFRVMPTSPEDFTGFGRISLIRKDIASGKFQTIPAVTAFESSEFVRPDPYAWSWALCAFLDGTPRYHERFQKLSGFTHGDQFRKKFSEFFANDEQDLAIEWLLFTSNLQYGYDIRRAAIDFQSGTVFTEIESDRSVKISADRGWQSSGIVLNQGDNYEVTAMGRFVLAGGDNGSKPWESEPQGISFQYFNGQPLGRLLGCVRPQKSPAGNSDDEMLKVISLGSRRTFQAPVSGTLYLRLNDAWNSLHDNQGDITVMIRPVIKATP